MLRVGELLLRGGPLRDFVVHEAAHVLHNWKRGYAGLPHTRNREWLLADRLRQTRDLRLRLRGVQQDRGRHQGVGSTKRAAQSVRGPARSERRG